MVEDTDPAALLDRVERPVFALDDDWRFSYVNEAARELLTDGRRIQGRVIWDSLPGVMETDIPETFHEAMQSGESATTVVSLPDGDVEFQAYPDEDGLTVLLDDASGRQDQQEQLYRYEAAFSAADDPIYVLDDSGRFQEVNDAMVGLTGYSEEELLGNTMSLLLDADQIERAEQRIRESVLEGDESVGTIEARIQTASGERLTCAINVALLPDDHDIRGTVGVMRDVTERRQREQRLAVLDRVLRHNIRNEMNVVMGRARIAKRKADDEVAEHIQKMLDKAQELVDVSQAVRQFADALDPGLGSANPRDTVDSVKNIVDDLDEEFPEAELRLLVREPAWMNAYESVFAAIEEVIRNGIEHCEEDTPHVEVTVDATGPPDEGKVLVEVADNGPGMPGPEQEVLTEGGETQLSHASGIGLWLVNWAVTKSGGDLTFDENDPKGSIVTIRLPRVEPPSEEEGEEADAPAD